MSTLSFASASAKVEEFTPGAMQPRFIVDQIPRKIGGRAKYNGASTAIHTAIVLLVGADRAAVRTLRASWYALRSSAAAYPLAYSDNDGADSFGNCVCTGIRPLGPIVGNAPKAFQRFEVNFEQLEE